uniref:Uncharacterized protein n=1 Tax=Panagrolaimus sp. ES5 TaxID=591445 RepID=A0AC34FVU2_9BILA
MVSFSVPERQESITEENVEEKEDERSAYDFDDITGTNSLQFEKSDREENTLQKTFLEEMPEGNPQQSVSRTSDGTINLLTGIEMLGVSTKTEIKNQSDIQADQESTSDTLRKLNQAAKQLIGKGKPHLCKRVSEKINQKVLKLNETSATTPFNMSEDTHELLCEAETTLHNLDLEIQKSEEEDKNNVSSVSQLPSSESKNSVLDIRASGGDNQTFDTAIYALEPAEVNPQQSVSRNFTDYTADESIFEKSTIDFNSLEDLLKKMKTCFKHDIVIPANFEKWIEALDDSLSIGGKFSSDEVVLEAGKVRDTLIGINESWNALLSKNNMKPEIFNNKLLQMSVTINKDHDNASRSFTNDKSLLVLTAPRESQTLPFGVNIDNSGEDISEKSHNGSIVLNEDVLQMVRESNYNVPWLYHQYMLLTDEQNDTEKHFEEAVLPEIEVTDVVTEKTKANIIEDSESP